MTVKIKDRTYNFSMLESITREDSDLFAYKHFDQVLKQLQSLEDWIAANNVKNNWTLSEKLAFLRNAEATIRTGAAIRRTQLAWIAVAAGTIATISGILPALA